MSGTRIFAVVVLLAMALSACSQLPGVNRQGSAGITKVDFDFNETGQMESASIIDGKNKASVTWSANLKEGTLDYSASGVSATELVALRAEVEKAQIAEMGRVVPGMTAAIMDAVLKAVGVP